MTRPATIYSPQFAECKECYAEFDLLADEGEIATDCDKGDFEDVSTYYHIEEVERKCPACSATREYTIEIECDC